MFIYRVWDYNNNSKLSHWNPDKASWNRTVSRITALEFVNAHDNTMLMVGSEDGCVRIWSNYTNTLKNREPSLVTAWQALPEIGNSNKTGYAAGKCILIMACIKILHILRPQ